MGNMVPAGFAHKDQVLACTSSIGWQGITPQNQRHVKAVSHVLVLKVIWVRVVVFKVNSFNAGVD